MIDKLKAEYEMYKQETQSKIEPLKIVLHESIEVGTQEARAEAEAEEKEEELSSLRGLLKEVLKSAHPVRIII